MAAEAVNSAQVANDQGALNYKIFSDVPIETSNLTVQNAAARQQRSQEAADAVHANAMNGAQQIAQLAAQQALQISQNGAMLAQAMLGRVSRHILDLSAEQASAWSRELMSDLPRELANISGQLASVQEMAKIANTTPPQTGSGGSFASSETAPLLQMLAQIEALIRSQQVRNNA